ncbi:HK97 family phage portal protein [Amycolatopsis sulphurea]|uniref:HK97 family phage portal protein n=1 Tax=Amycolatopsis sulphurea TaxID=76022 RepID=A0A2A9FBH7_9PSEU|nr:phage portal protein [Amycolatopsis sulphurea]PFG48121.1 HK97 family phage portal protein [Amycolatopsis sulphurea]
MGFLSFVEKRSAPGSVEKATTTAELFGTDTPADEPLTRETALKVSAVFACVRLLTDAIATLPVDAYRRVAGRRRPLAAPDWLIKPNPDIGRIAFFGQIMTSLLLEGNAYILVSRVGGRVVALDVIPASMVEPRYVATRSGRKCLVYQLSVAGEKEPSDVVGALGPEDVVHLQGLPLAGELRGVSPLKAASLTIGSALSALEYGAAFFADGALPGAVVNVPGPMTPEGLRAARQTWRNIHGGRGNRHGLAILTEGATFQKVTISPDEAQFLQTRQFQVPDVARLFGVPPHLIADATNSTSWGSGLSEQNTSFAQYSTRPWVERIEEALTALLVADTGDKRAFVRLNIDAIQRGSLKDRMDTYRVGLASGVYTRNEVRAWEDLPPDSDYGDFFQLPLNLALLTPDGPMSLSGGKTKAEPGDEPDAPPEPGMGDDPEHDEADGGEDSAENPKEPVDD